MAKARKQTVRATNRVERVKAGFGRLRKWGHKRAGRVKSSIQKKPLTSFWVSLGIMMIVLVVVRILGTPKVEEAGAEAEPRVVQTYQVGAVPSVSAYARVEKTGVVTVVAQTAGVVNRVNVGEGERVRAGETLVGLASTYTGANAASVQRQLAEKSYNNSKDSFETQLELIRKRREMVNAEEANADELREISEESLERTRNQLDLNEDILGIVEDNLAVLEAADPGDPALILASKQLKGQYVAAVNGLKDAIANLEYSTDEDKPANRLADLGREISVKGLELEEKGLRLSLEVAELNLRLARIGEAVFYPQSPFGGVVERVYVKPGQMVSPGMPLVAITGDEQSVKLVALVGADIAERVSRFDTARLMLPSGVIEQVPQYVATEPTDGNLFAITWCRLDGFEGQLANQEFVEVEIPVGYADTIGTVPFVPIDSVFQTQDSAFVFVMGCGEPECDSSVEGDMGAEGVVENREVKLGSVFGSFVQIDSGLMTGDRVILDRMVVTGDRVVGE